MEYAQIVSVIRNEVLSKKDGLTVSEIIERLKGNKENLFSEEIDPSLIKSALRNESRNPMGDIMQCPKKKRGAIAYKLRPAIASIPGGGRKRNKPTTDVDDSNRIGKAGEMAVLSELTFRGYNATAMTVDEGIDLVASKNNVFFFIQVKTTYLDASARFSVQIPVVNYARVQQNNVIYIFVIREQIGMLKYFIFHQSDINSGIINGYIEKTDSNIIVKIEYDQINHIPYLYNGKNRTIAKSYQAEEISFDL